MYKLFKVVLISILFSSLIFTGCKKNKAPDIPSTPSGPKSGCINTEYTFISSAEDPNGDSIAVRFDWGDGDTSNWSEWKGSSDWISMSHIWSDSGIFLVRAQANDKPGTTSDWSESLSIKISKNEPPNTPAIPNGFSNGTLNTLYNFSSISIDNDGDSIAIRFAWGDGDISDWCEWQASGDSVSMSHSWLDTGSYSIRAQAKDKLGVISDWSVSHIIVISNITFIRTFGGTSEDNGYSVQQTTDGGYIITGETWSYGAGGSDIYLIKTDASGNQQWYKTLGSLDDDCGYSVQQTLDGGYIITGVTWSYGGGGADVYLIKTDAIGNQQWYKTLGGSDDDVGYSVQQTTDGGYIITGVTWSYGVGGADVYLIKTDVSGNQQWYKAFGGSGDDYGYSVQQTTDGPHIRYIITGSIEFAEDIDVQLIKTNYNGNQKWYNTFGGLVVDVGYSVQQTMDDGYIISGLTRSFGAGGSDMYLIKTDTNGYQQWAKTFGGSGDDYGYSVQQTSDGGYIITGVTSSYGAGGSDVYLIKTDENGNQQWYKIFGGTYNDFGRSVQQTSDGGYIIAGNTSSFGGGGSDVYLIKTDENGNVE